MGICFSRTKSSKKTSAYAPIAPAAEIPTCIISTKPLPISASTIQRNIREDYTLGKVIGHGHFGTVRECKQINTSNKLAVKSIEKRKVKKEIYLLKREVDTLLTLDHPNLIRTFATYEDEKYLHIITELCTGGELLDRIMSKSRYKERGAAKIMTQILLAVSHLHLHGICHRDLKPENFLFASEEKNADLKLIDFGLAHKFGDKQLFKMTSVVGTPYYVAPEVFTGNYGPMCDMWSVGVIMYMLLSGSPPFLGKTTKEIFQNIHSNDPSFPSAVWGEVSFEGKKLIRRLLSRVPANRPTAAEALESPWFKTRTDAVIQIDPHILESFINYKSESKFKKEALSVIVKNLSIEEIKDLKEAFIAIDYNHSGDLTFEEIEATLKKQGYDIASNKIRQMMEQTGINNKGCINYSDFLRATVSSKWQLIEHKLWDCFKVFDVDKSGFITADNLKQAFLHMGKENDDEAIQNMMREANIVNGRLSFDEFKELFKNS